MARNGNDDQDRSIEGDVPGYKGKMSARLRQRRREAGVIQVGYFIRESDKAAVAEAIRDYTDKAWLALYEAGAVINGVNEARAADIRARLEMGA